MRSKLSFIVKWQRLRDDSHIDSDEELNMTNNNVFGKTISTLACIAFSSSSIAHDRDRPFEPELDDYSYEVFLDSPDPMLNMVFNEDGLQQIEWDNQTWQGTHATNGFHL
ncbi:hypothetical protein [Vibrio ezurae]|uniref:hypothetical protein n=1 Tax=Vibrio ezurae TaxID=252583 RepID=UPI00059418CA|nr:hypothetical protein [Vibrio ezurae]